MALKQNNLHIYNTLTRSKVRFEPLAAPAVGMYVCGPTVYGDAHIGHAKSYVSFDVIVRYLRYLGYGVRYVQNITDVGHLTDDADQGEDKVEKKARAERIHPMQIAEMYTRSYFEDMDRLNVLRPDISPRASGHIIEQIELVKRLLARGHAYEVGGNVYFDVASWPKYGRLSGRSVEDMLAGARVEPSADKRAPADFALWKRAEPGHIMQWPSPWGMGYPGWHLECSAMSMKYLGDSFDIHGGGIENQFPHHEDEIAQAEAATGKPFAKYWIHNNMVTVGGQKMGKSLGNFITLKDAFQKWDPMVLRLFILQSHYRSPLDFSDEALGAAREGLERLVRASDAIKARRPSASTSATDSLIETEIEAVRSRFFDAMDDDFNTPMALASLFDLATLANKVAQQDSLSVSAYIRLPFAFGEMARSILGLGRGSIPDVEIGILRETQDDIMAIPTGKLPAELAAMITESQEAIVAFRDKVDRSNLAKVSIEMMRIMIDLRNDARAAKNFAQADGIRKRLDEIGIILEDTKEGTQWRFK
ncbi:MAG: cysteine--tRNA ligase [Planctomycetota bacterium]|nr:cysteine--tRNA ligase [Planctomycetota bacterium]